MAVIYKINGREVSETFFQKYGKEFSEKDLLEHEIKRVACDCSCVQGYGESNPGKSISMSVHPNQIPEMNRLIKEHGIQGVYFDPTKRDNCVITSRKGRKEYMKMMGYHDADGGFGDG